MLILPRPAPGELAHGYWGRLSLINLFPSPEKAMGALVQHFGTPKHVSQKAFTLAAASGMSSGEFVRSHTLLPYLLASESQTPEAFTGFRRGGPRGNHLSVLGLARENAYCCSECIREQQESAGHPYWLCEHQLPGILWCPRHEVRLAAVKEQDQLYRMPPLLSGATAFSSEITNAGEQQTVRRFAEISKGILARKRTNDLAFGTFVLGDSLKQSLVSDEVARQFPRVWCDTVLPGLKDKVVGEPIKLIDGYSAFHRPFALALALTVFFDSSQSALDCWFGEA